MARATNFANPDYPELEDFGEFSVVGDNGSSGYFRMDWFTPDGLRTWGDGRTTILGTKGYIELRKYVDLGQQLDQPARANNVYIATQDGEEQHQVTGKIDGEGRWRMEEEGRECGTMREEGRGPMREEGGRRGGGRK